MDEQITKQIANNKNRIDLSKWSLKYTIKKNSTLNRRHWKFRGGWGRGGGQIYTNEYYYWMRTLTRLQLQLRVDMLPYRI